MSKKPTFSIIIPTRDRSELCMRAIRSVLRQSYDDIELVIVDDGSDTSHRDALDAFAADVDASEKSIQWHHLHRITTGHGVALVRNLGVSLSTGRFVGMLDDDDEWIDEDYLLKIARSIKSETTDVDLVFANQDAMKGGVLQTGSIWIEPLQDILKARGQAISPGTASKVTLDDLLQINGFCHLNTTIVARALFDAIGGFDLCLRYESDRDLYLRLIDKASVILHLPDVVSRHYIPDLAKTANVSTRVNWLEKRLFQSRILQKMVLYGQHESVKKRCRSELATVYKHMCKLLIDAGNAQTSAMYARKALACKFTLKWAAYTSYVSIKAVFKRQ